MSRLENILESKEPLEADERADLLEWLEVLGEDVESFGPTENDLQRMAAIRRRLQEGTAA